MDWYLTHIDEIEATAAKDGASSLEAMPWFEANVAWVAIKAGRNDMGDLIEKFTLSALTSRPEAPEMKGTRGAWLIENGEYHSGLALLTEAVRSVVDPIDKADFCHFLSRGWKALSDEARSDGYRQLRRHLIGNDRDRVNHPAQQIMG